MSAERSIALQAQSLVAAGRLADALVMLGQACRAIDAPPLVRKQYGCLLAHAGRYDEAIKELLVVTQADPGAADAWYFLGTAQLQRGSATAAIAPLRQACQLQPHNSRMARALAEAEFRGGHPLDALPHWERAHLADSDDIEVALCYGETLSRLGQSDLAAEVYARLLDRHADSASLWLARAQAEEECGRREDAEKSYDTALQIRPGWPFAIAGLVGLLRGQASPQRVAAAREALGASKELADEERARIGYALGKHYDAVGDFPSAMACWHEANARLQHVIGGYDPRPLHETLRRARLPNAYPGRDTAATGCNDERPVFVVGMPRSGTTLTEQMLAAHPLVHGCGELPDMALIARGLAVGGTHMLLPDVSQQRLDESHAADAAARYLAAATRLSIGDVRRLVDKAPTNYSLLGLIARLFPNSRIVWCRRDPRDIAISIYSEHFAHSEAYATSLQGIGDCISVHNELMQHWRETLQLPILEVNYEELVTSPEVHARRMLEFLDLPWDERCLLFHTQARNVQTPSRWQVRQPIHTRSIGRWRHYADELPAILTDLESKSPG